MKIILLIIVIAGVIIGGYFFLQRSDGGFGLAENTERGAHEVTDNVAQNSLESANGDYRLLCTNSYEVGTHASFDEKNFNWYNRFISQIINGWTVSQLCFNEELNKVAYLKYEDARYLNNSQLGVYDISRDEFSKSPFLKGVLLCHTIHSWSRKDVINFTCGSADAGHSTQHSLRYVLGSDTYMVLKTEVCDPLECTTEER